MPQNPLLAPPPVGPRPGGGAGSRLEICVDDEFQEEEDRPPAPPGASVERTNLGSIFAGTGQAEGLSSSLSTTLQTMPPSVLVASATLPRVVARVIGQVPHGSLTGGTKALPLASLNGPNTTAGQPAVRPPLPSAVTDAIQGNNTGTALAPPPPPPPSRLNTAAVTSSALLGFDDSLLTDSQGKEQSFEEARAAALLLRPRPQGQAKPQVADAARKQDSLALASCPTAMPKSQGEPCERTVAATDKSSDSRQPMEGQQLQHQQVGGTEFHEPTVTLSTLAAFDVLNEMFGGGGGRGFDELPSAAVARPSEHPAAFASCSLDPTSIPLAPRAPASAPPSYEPTITISTKAAFDAINDMFSDRLPHEECREKQRKVVGG